MNAFTASNNEQRSARAWATIAPYINATGCDTDDAITDLLADLMHFCERRHINFDDQLSRATDHYSEERADDH